VYRKNNGCGKKYRFYHDGKIVGLNSCFFWLSIKEEEDFCWLDPDSDLGPHKKKKGSVRRRAKVIS
jgi:hypothetical protein